MLAPNFPLQENYILSDNQSGVEAADAEPRLSDQQKIKPSTSNSWPL